jgi:hypothetical protein
LSDGFFQGDQSKKRGATLKLRIWYDATGDREWCMKQSRYTETQIVFMLKQCLILTYREKEL